MPICRYLKDLCKITQTQPGQQRYTLVVSQVFFCVLV